MRYSPLVLLLIVILPILFYFHFRGVVHQDEGYVLNSAQRVIDSQVLYRDFHFSYTPISVFATSLSFLLFGESVLASRIGMMFLDVLSVALIFQITKFITKRVIYSVFSSITFVAWGPSHINFSHPVMFVIPITLLVIFLILTYDRYKIRIIPFLIGVLSFSIFLAKQNFGIVIFSVLTYLFALHENRLRIFLYALYGFLWGLILFLFYLLKTESFEAFVHDFYVIVTRNLVRGEFTTPTLFIDAIIPTLIRAFFYFVLPFLSSLLFVLLVFRKKYKLLFIPILFLSYYLVGIQQTTNYAHLAPLLGLSGIAIVILINKMPTLLSKLLGYSLLSVLIVAGFHTALYKNFYSGDIPLGENNMFIPGRISLFSSEKAVKQYYGLRRTIENYTKPHDYIFVDSYSPIVYFIYDRKNPTPYDLPGFDENKKYEKIVIYSLVAKDVKLILLTSKVPTTKIQEFVVKNYSYSQHVGDYYVYIKN